MIPNFDEIDELHRKYAPSQEAYELVYRHCMIVANMAREICRRQNNLFVQRCTLGDDVIRQYTTRIPPRLLNTDKTVVGALLHDIGTYSVIDNDGSNGKPVSFDRDRYILHGLAGYDLLKAEGVDEEIAEFCRNHTGVGITKEMVEEQHLPLPPANYTPKNLEQEVVMYADNFNSKSEPPRFVTAAKAIKRCAKFGKENEQKMRDLVGIYGEPKGLKEMAEQYHMVLVDA
ncbi:HD domain-containing protein [Bifidobacterium sp. SMB2]|uniref:HD domain-containing protein n=1 Tax=Bifidobacterium saimiriisciurei TaxID=2661627 RepID=A0ABX0C8F1_9BIFI|nr:MULTISPECIES: HD domain-containing protein [Bifidobacterium]NEG95394.1 HD domain-containing protein [Bifidobacterium sp. SMB2]NEH11422.1 HD domain-containing protein [Bifidobacterium saimiriisciurei]